MKLHQLIFCFLGSLFLNAAAQSEVSTKEQIKNTLRQMPAKAQFSVAMINGDKVEFLGFLKQKDTIVAITNQHYVFEIGSITKVFTSTVLSNLILQDKIKENQQVASFFDFPFYQNRAFTVQQLANHTSGLPRLPSNLDDKNYDMNNPYKMYDETLLLDYLKNAVTQTQAAGEKYDYSNIGTGLLGYVLGKSQKSSIQKLVQQLILKKYGMTETFTNRNDNKKLILVKGVNQFGFETSNWDLNILFGAGGMLSTTADLSKFVQAHFKEENKELALTRTPTFTISPTMQIGLGWHILQRPNGAEYHWHNGGTGGYTSSLFMDLKQKKGIVILSNISAAHPNSKTIDELAIALIEN